MSQIIQILQTENERSDENRNVIHLYQEGTFYRAYNWSAWLCHRFIHQFKVTHKNLKGIDDSVLFVGFPLTSLEKYFAAYNVLEVAEKAKDILLSGDIIPDDATMEIMQTDYQTWKASIPLTQSNATQKDKTQQPSQDVQPSQHSTHTITGIMQQILAYPLEQKSPMECMLFVAQTKQQLAGLI